MIILKIAVMSDCCGWVYFDAGFFVESDGALAMGQRAIYAGRYPDRVFAVQRIRRP